MLIHPATKILLWLGLALAVQGAGLVPLALVTLLVAIALIVARAIPASLLMLRRARWLILPLLLIYAFATPGIALFPGLGASSPTLEGVRGGVLQAWRLVLLLLALALLLKICSRASLLGGLHALLRPFHVVGLDSGRVAVRLWLTLHYVEGSSREKLRNWRNELHAVLDPTPGIATEVNLEIVDFTWRDSLALTLAIVLTALALWPGLMP